MSVMDDEVEVEEQLAEEPAINTPLYPSLGGLESVSDTYQ